MQLSDVVAGILGKLFIYINSTNNVQRRKDIATLSKIQIDNILLIDKLRTRADMENHGFLCTIGPVDEVTMVDNFFELVKNKVRKN